MLVILRRLNNNRCKQSFENFHLQKGLGDRPPNSMGGPKPLTFPEKKFLLAVERGDVASTRWVGCPSFVSDEKMVMERGDVASTRLVAIMCVR